MKKFWFLLILTMTFLFNSCNNTIELSEIIDIKTTKDSFDSDYQNANSKVPKIALQEIKEKIYKEYPDVVKNYVDKMQIVVVKKTVSWKTVIFNKETNTDKNSIYVKIAMDYEKSKKDQGELIIEFAKILLIDELEKLDINVVGKEWDVLDTLTNAIESQNFN
jgi:hypothetical protein